MEERLLCTQKAGGSSPPSSTGGTREGFVLPKDHDGVCRLGRLPPARSRISRLLMSFHALPVHPRRAAICLARRATELIGALPEGPELAPLVPLVAPLVPLLAPPMPPLAIPPSAAEMLSASEVDEREPPAKPPRPPFVLEPLPPGPVPIVPEPVGLAACCHALGL